MTTRIRVSIEEFEKRFNHYAEAAQTAAIFITRKGYEDLVLLSAAEYANLRKSFRCVVALDQLTEVESAELFKALDKQPRTPASIAADYLMPDASSKHICPPAKGPGANAFKAPRKRFLD